MGFNVPHKHTHVRHTYHLTPILPILVLSFAFWASASATELQFRWLGDACRESLMKVECVRMNE